MSSANTYLFEVGEMVMFYPREARSRQGVGRVVEVTEHGNYRVHFADVVIPTTTPPIREWCQTWYFDVRGEWFGADDVGYIRPLAESPKQEPEPDETHVQIPASVAWYLTPAGQKWLWERMPQVPFDLGQPMQTYAGSVLLVGYSEEPHVLTARKQGSEHMVMRMVRLLDGHELLGIPLVKPRSEDGLTWGEVLEMCGGLVVKYAAPSVEQYYKELFNDSSE